MPLRRVTVLGPAVRLISKFKLGNNPSAAAYSVVLLILAAVISRISFLGSKSLWYDETATAYQVTLPLKSLFSTHLEMNMFLYYVLLHVWTLVAGTSEFMLRFPSALFGAATVPLVYALGVELRDRRTGLLAALLTTINATCIQYAQTARSYSMFVALATLASIFFIRAVKRGSIASLVGYIVSGTFSVLAHLFGVLVLPSQWLSLFLFRPGRKKAIGLTVCMLTVVVLSTPAFFFAISGYHGNIDWVPKTSLHSILGLFFTFAGMFDTFDGPTTTLTVLVTMLYALGVVLAVVWSQRDDWPALGFLLLSICLPVASAVAVSLVKPVFVPRYLLAELPPFVLLAAIGFQRLKPAFLIPTVLAISMLSLVQDYSYYSAPPLEDWRGVVSYVAKHSRPGDRLLIFPSLFSCSVEYYVSRRDHPETFPTRILQTRVGPTPNSIEDPERLLSDSNIGAGGRIWVTSASAVDETGIRLIFSDEQVVDEPAFAGVHLLLLERNP